MSAGVIKPTGAILYREDVALKKRLPFLPWFPCRLPDCHGAFRLPELAASLTQHEGAPVACGSLSALIAATAAHHRVATEGPVQG